MTGNSPHARHPVPGPAGCLAGLALASALCLTPAFAQDPPIRQQEAAALEEIVVTARKTEESVQDVPMSIQVLSANFLDVTDPTHFFDLQNNVPGLVVNNMGMHGAGFSLRAVADQGGSSLSVATHLNGVYLGTSNLSGTRLFDLERVEVLKGPQGTLYGRNATGGSINLITQAPTHELSADVEAAYGSFDTSRIQGHINVPFSRSDFRIAWIVSEGDGFIRNSVDNRRFAEKDFWGMRASYRFNATERLRLDVMAQHVVDDGASGELWLPNPKFLPDPSDIHLTTVTLQNPFLYNESDIISATVVYDLGFATLDAVSGYAGNSIRDLDDCAGIPILAGCERGTLPTRTRQFSQEIRLVSPGDASVDWLVGAYYYDDDADRQIYQYTPEIDPDPTINRQTKAAETTIAVFGQSTWRLADKWSVTGGLRLNREGHRLSTIGTGTDDSPTLVEDEEVANNQSWRVDLQYAISDDVLAYGGVSTGFKSGGFTIQPGGILDEFAPEELIAYEAGVKSQWLARRFRINAAAFYYDFRDLQVSTFTSTDDDALIFETDNAARAEIYGIDMDADLSLGDRLSLSGGVVWLPKREFVEYRNDQAGDTLSGNDLTRAPEWSVSAALDYNHPMGRRGRFSARVEYNYRSSYFYTTDNNPDFSQDAFSLVNLFLRFEPTSEKWYVFASGRNLGNEDYFNQVFLQASPGYPDTYETGFGYRFW